MKNISKLLFSALMLFFPWQNSNAQSYNFDPITQMLDDSSAVYLNRIYVEVFQNDTSIYQYQAGWLNCNNVRLGLASSTKWISAAIFLRLAEKGWINLDDSIGTYLPVFTQYGKGHITLRQSYSMSSGVFNPSQNNYHRDPSLTLAQSIDSIAKNVQILYPTGAMIGYDGSMMHVWGRAAEVVDSINGYNRDWRTIAKEEFFDLMEMDSTDYTDFLPNPAVAGGIETTPCDYLKFLKMLSNNGIYYGDTILQQSSIDEMFIDQTNSAPIYHTFWPSNHPDFPNGLDTMRYTFGAWWTELDNSDNIIQLTSPGAFGHFPFYDRCRNIYGTFFCFIPVFQGGGAVVENTYLKFLRYLREEIGACDLITGLSDFTLLSDLNVFPNPSSTTITLSSEQLKEPFEARIYDTNGSMILYTSNQKTINISNLSKGLYVLKIKTYKSVATQKFIKQ